MTELTKDQKEKLKALESDVKNAFKEERFDAVRDMAEKIKSIDPENRTAVRILEKTEKAKAEAKKKENTVKIKEYDKMIQKMLKEGNLGNARKLSEELKEFDPKLAEKWMGKIEKIEAEAKKKENADKIKALEGQLKTAFKEERFEEVQKIASKVREMDPKNKTASKMVSKIEKAKEDAIARENKDKIKALQKDIKSAFKEKHFEDVKKLCSKLKEFDPKDKISEKWLKKVAKTTGGEEVKEEVKKVSAEPAKEKEKKEGFFAKMFKKKEKAPAPAKAEEKAEPVKAEKTKETPVKTAEGGEAAESEKEIKKEAPKPMPAKAEVKSVIEERKPSAPVVAPITPVPAKPVTTETKPAPAKVEGEKAPTRAETHSGGGVTPKGLEGKEGNIFTRMFKKKTELEKPEKSIIDTIVAKTSEKKAEVTEKPKKPKEEGAAFAAFGRVILQFSVAFIVISAGFFYTQNIDSNNTVLGLFGIEENYASRLHAANETLEQKEEEERELNREINRYQKGYDNKYEVIINQIVEKRLNWPDVLSKINEVADFIYERNSISQYIKFNSFSFDAEKGLVRVSGSLSDPLGKNLTKMAELEEAFKYYPQDKNNPDDKTKPYFYDFQEFKSLSKSYDKRTGKYTSNFQLSFALQPGEEE